MLAIIILIGCADKEAVPLPFSTPVDQVRFFNLKLVIPETEDGDIVFSGHTLFPDGTPLYTRLYLGVLKEKHEKAGWWPSEKEIQVQNRTWHIVVSLGKNGAPDDLPHDFGYYFTVWAKEDPSSVGMIYWDFL
jgi:hypothetical protein